MSGIKIDHRFIFFFGPGNLTEKNTRATTRVSAVMSQNAYHSFDPHELVPDGKTYLENSKNLKMKIHRVAVEGALLLVNFWYVSNIRLNDTIV